MSVYIQFNQNCNNQCVRSSDKYIMTMTKGKKRRSNFFDKSGSRFWWTMIEIFILGDHKWFPIIRRIFLAWLQKFIFPFLENFLRPVTTIAVIMTNCQSHDHEVRKFKFMLWCPRLSWPWWIFHDHDKVADLLLP